MPIGPSHYCAFCERAAPDAPETIDDQRRCTGCRYRTIYDVSRGSASLPAPAKWQSTRRHQPLLGLSSLHFAREGVSRLVDQAAKALGADAVAAERDSGLLFHEIGCRDGY